MDYFRYVLYNYVMTNDVSVTIFGHTLDLLDGGRGR